MKNNYNQLAVGIRRALMAGCVVVAPMAIPAFAQTADEAVKLDKVEVTGSRVRRVDA